MCDDEEGIGKYHEVASELQSDRGDNSTNQQLTMKTNTMLAARPLRSENSYLALE